MFLPAQPSETIQAIIGWEVIELEMHSMTSRSVCWCGWQGIAAIFHARFQLLASQIPSHAFRMNAGMHSIKRNLRRLSRLGSDIDIGVQYKVIGRISHIFCIDISNHPQAVTISQTRIGSRTKIKIHDLLNRRLTGRSGILH